MYLRNNRFHTNTLCIKAILAFSHWGFSRTPAELHGNLFWVYHVPLHDCTLLNEFCSFDGSLQNIVFYYHQHTSVWLLLSFMWHWNHS